MEPRDDNLSPRPRGRGIYLLPNLFTTGGLFGGFFAIIAASQGRIEAACVAIFIAAILDAPVIGRILAHLGLQARAPPRAPACGDLQQAA